MSYQIAAISLPFGDADRSNRLRVATPARTSGSTPSWGISASIGWTVLAMAVCVVATRAHDTFVTAPLINKPFMTLSHREYATQALSVSGTYIVWLLVIVAAVRVKGRGVTEYLGWNRPAIKRLALGLSCVGAYIALLSFAANAMTLQPYRAALAAGMTPAWYVAAQFQAFILVPIVEESTFRGFLWRGCEDRFGRRAAFFVTSALFAIAHFKIYCAGGNFNPFMLFYYMLVSMFFGLFRMRTGGTSTTMLMHGAFNFGIVIIPLIASRG